MLHLCNTPTARRCRKKRRKCARLATMGRTIAHGDRNDGPRPPDDRVRPAASHYLRGRHKASARQQRAIRFANRYLDIDIKVAISSAPCRPPVRPRPRGVGARVCVGPSARGGLAGIRAPCGVRGLRREVRGHGVDLRRVPRVVCDGHPAAFRGRAPALGTPEQGGRTGNGVKYAPFRGAIYPIRPCRRPKFRETVAKAVEMCNYRVSRG